MIVTDVMFLHERGLYMGIYSWAAWSGVMLGPVVAGVTAQNYGWRSFWWVSTALSCFSLLYQLLFLPETKWSIRHVGIIHDHVADGNVTGIAADIADEKPMAEVAEQFESSAEQRPSSEIIVKLSGTPSKRQFRVFNGFDKDENFLESVLLPFKLFAFPIVQWSSFVFSWCASCFLVVNITQSQAFAGPPWLLSPSAVGYTNLAIFVGGSIALLTAGPFSDWVSMRATKKNRGIREPEMRLAAMIPYACCALIGSVIMACGYQYGWRWEIIVIIGYTLIGMQLAAISAVSTTYAIDSYKPVAGEFLVSATVNKNLWAYGLTKFLNIWIIKDGYIGPVMLNTGLFLLWVALAVPLYFLGKKLRGWTKDSKVHQHT